jgi:hypothetical protein
MPGTSSTTTTDNGEITEVASPDGLTYATGTVYTYTPPAGEQGLTIASDSELSIWGSDGEIPTIQRVPRELTGMAAGVRKLPTYLYSREQLRRIRSAVFFQTSNNGLRRTVRNMIKLLVQHGIYEVDE